MTRPAYAAREVGAVCAVLAAGLLALSARYGPHRDELYFVVAGHHPAWGYPDQPAVTPLVAALADSIAPSHLVVLRAASILAVVGVVLLAVQQARLLGAQRAGQVLTAASVGFSALVPGLGHLLSTATFDLLAWTAVLVVVTQSLVDDRPRLWLLAGAIAGVGLNNKHAVAFCLLGVLVGVAVVRETRAVLRTPWPWLAGLLALAMWLPNLVWQARHDWPVFALSADIADEYGGVGGRISMVLEAFIMFSPLIGIVWILGIVQLLRRPEWVRTRPVAIAFLVVLAVFLVTGGKGYYLAGLVPPLIAAGCTVLAASRSRRGVTRLGAVLVASAAVAYPAVLPVLPAGTFAGSPWEQVNDDQLDTIGWPGYADQVRAVVDGLSPEDRRTAVIFTGNYGEAGAMSWYDVGLPVYSGHNGYRAWGPPPDSASPVVVVYQGSPAGDFEGCTLEARLRNSAGADNEEVGAGVWVCDGPAGSWSEAWPDLVHYDA
ncbi:glycosyltransferase family 39 protein [Nocardioides mangrovi]|uniref:Glycosyltransferase family 39 protein n=1 Tax=Nocardioides mangrovi TaxID=2874580 RepID=A0ABS7UAK8_9ACTN|nr:glycosyltransferase family 39 protein [Nocardioides mangrovi]MBZ5738038.1 glycosyltransferase family 39 protein [Nocardioides mangrovi]